MVCTLNTAAVTESWRLQLFSYTSSSFLCAGTLSPRGKCCYCFARGLVGVDKHLFQMVSLATSMTLPLNHISFYYSPMSMLFRNKNNYIQSKTRREISSISSITKLKDSRWCACFITRWRVYFINACSSCKV